MNTKKAIEILIKKKIVKNPEVSSLGSGNNYNAFLLDDGNLKYVLRFPKKISSSKNRIKKAYIFSKFVENEKIDFIQKAIFMDEKERFLVCDYIDGQEFSVKNLDQRKLKEFILKMIKINNLKYKRFEKFLLKNNKNIDSVERSFDRVNLIINKKLPFINKNLNSFKSLIFKKDFNYLKNELFFLKNSYKDLNEKKLFFDHGDLAGANIFLVKKRGLVFIDWDNAKFTDDLGIILAHVFFYSNEISSEFINNFINFYLKNSKLSINKKNLYLDVVRGLRLLCLSGIVWAWVSAINSKKNKEDFYSNYIKIANERLAIYKNIIGADGGTRTHKPCGTRV